VSMLILERDGPCFNPIPGSKLPGYFHPVPFGTKVAHGCRKIHDPPWGVVVYALARIVSAPPKRPAKRLGFALLGSRI
jgi:hypothetical protein